MAARPSDRVEAATNLANLALDSGRNRKIIIEEGGVPPLLALLRDGATSLDAQIAATVALINLSANRELVSLIVADLAVPIVVQVLADSPIRLQARLAILIARMAAHNPVAQEEFARENAIRPLVSLLSFELPLDDTSPNSKKPTSIHTLVRINRESATNSPNPPNAKGVSTSRDQHPHPPYYYYHHRKERENESPEMKLHLKVACAKALWMLSRNCISKSRKITETKGLLCLSKLIERVRGELQINCLMTVMEIAAVAESDADLRCSAFKMNSPAAKSTLGIQDELSGGKVDGGGAPPRDPPKRHQLSTSVAAAATAGSSASTSASKKPRLISSQTTPAMSSGWWAMKEERRAREVLRRSSSILVTTSMGRCLARTSGGSPDLATRWEQDVEGGGSE